MDYNSNRKKLVLPEYGRNIQNMVDHTMTIEDREERNRAAKAIIDVMGNMYPYLRDIPDFRHKLWDHLAIMSDFKLDIDSPYETPNKEVLDEKPEKVPYSSNAIKYRHYGKTLQLLVDKAGDFDEGQEREVLIQLLANHMKKCYLVWNKDAVEDEKIFEDIQELSNGKISFSEDYKLIEARDLLQRNRGKKKDNKKGDKKDKKGKGGRKY
ncbi:DUF4290 domain-containing protein [Puteibacter caeruleilacunae]|nr:DUF4290 domain-containing protein [Puteibacter caeruleilacunae]